MTTIRTFKADKLSVVILLVLLSLAVTMVTSDEQNPLNETRYIRNRNSSTVKEAIDGDTLSSRLACVSTPDAFSAAIQSARPSTRKIITLCGNTIITLYKTENLSNKNIELRCYSGGCILDGFESSRMFVGKNVVFTMNGVQIQNGIADVGDGGAVSFENSTIKLVNSYFLNNTSTFGSGGAVFVKDSSLVLESTNFVDNIAYIAGGAIFMMRSTLTASIGSFQENSAYYAAAMYLMKSRATLKDVDFARNTAENVSTKQFFNDNAKNVVTVRYLST
jgi:predicted outer membrane repeat protein